MNTSQLKKWMLLSFMVSGLMSCTQKEVTLGSLDVIPIPSEVVKLDDGSSFVIDGATKICYPEGNEKMKRNAEFLASYIKKIAATEVKLSTKEGDNAIVLSLDNTLTEEEGYELNVSEERISLKGKTKAGVFYGIQTLHKALSITDWNHTCSHSLRQRKRFSAVWLQRIHGRRGPAFLWRGLFEGNNRHAGIAQYQLLSLASHGRPGLAHRNQEIPETDGNRFEEKGYD